MSEHEGQNPEPEQSSQPSSTPSSVPPAFGPPPAYPPAYPPTQASAPPPPFQPAPPRPYPNPQYPPPQNAYYQPQPPYPAPVPQFQARRRSVWPVIVGVGVLIFVGVSALLGLVATSAGSTPGGSSVSFNPFASKIGLLEVEGELGEGSAYPADTRALTDQVREWIDNPRIKAIVVRVNSPGGAVSGTQDLYTALLDFRATKRPVIACMGDLAASGGFYTAMAAQKVYANPGTLTGSVGVIMSFWETDALTDKVGLKSQVIKSGEFKDIGSMSRPMTDAEKALLQKMISDVYEQFLEAVAVGRASAVREVLAKSTGKKPADITPDEITAHLRSICDGRVYSGRQAVEYGMVDQLGTLNTAIEDTAKLVGLPPNPAIARIPQKPKGLFGTLETKMNTLSRITPGTVRMEYRFCM